MAWMVRVKIVSVWWRMGAMQRFMVGTPQYAKVLVPTRKNIAIRQRMNLVGWFARVSRGPRRDKIKWLQNT